MAHHNNNNEEPKLKNQVLKEAETSLITYSEADFEQCECTAFVENKALDAPKQWVHLYGLKDEKSVKALGESLEIHSLVIEDIHTTNNRPKIEIHDDYIFIVLKSLIWNEKLERTEREQICLILKKNTVALFQEYKNTLFDSVKERLQNTQSRMRTRGSDYLMYSLIDTVVDNYFEVLEQIGERIEALESRILNYTDTSNIHQLHRLKRELIHIRRAVWPIRELISALLRKESGLINESTTLYLRDVNDHIVQIIETIETYRDTLSGMIDLHLSSLNNRMNEIMKVLTIIATIFIPLTFITGVYGMNFKHMPEIQVPWAYPATLGGMALIAIVMLIFFRLKKWL